VRKRLGPWPAVVVVAVVTHQAGQEPLPEEEVGALRQEGAGLLRMQDVSASNPNQLPTRGIIRTKNELDKPLRLKNRRTGKDEDWMSKVIHT
jgi:hypothetical protein